MLPPGDGAAGGPPSGVPDGSPDGSHPTLEQVLEHGGWLLVDPGPTAAAHPDTFATPGPEELAALGPGSCVKVMVRLADLADSVRDRVAAHDVHGRPRLSTVTERRWLVVLRRHADLLTCVLDNEPYAAYSRLVAGAEVTVPVASVIATGSGPDDLDADRVPVRGARSHAEPDRGDCGWVVFAGYRSVDEVADGPGFDVVTVQQACPRDRRILRHLALPEGWGFTAGSHGDHLHPVHLEE